VAIIDLANKRMIQSLLIYRHGIADVGMHSPSSIKWRNCDNM